MTGPLFSTRKRLADEALAAHPQADDWSERDRTIFRAGAMMGVTRGYALAVAPTVDTCACGNKFDGDNFCMPSACQDEV